VIYTRWFTLRISIAPFEPRELLTRYPLVDLATVRARMEATEDAHGGPAPRKRPPGVGSAT
jgi:hypothetical protein